VSVEGDAKVHVLRGVGVHTLSDCATNAACPRIETNLRAVGVEPAELLLTHSHSDHIQAAHGWQATCGNPDPMSAKPERAETPSHQTTRVRAGDRSTWDDGDMEGSGAQIVDRLPRRVEQCEPGVVPPGA
jgi:glyoxylase-like metal-dependent hydrolase (beta-lactamase superfamily II)